MRIVASCLFALLVLWNINAVAQHSHIRVYATAIANDSSGAFMGGSSNGSGLYQSDDTGKTWRHLGWNNIKAYSMDEVISSNGRILYLATGLGVLRSTDFGEHWKVITDWRFAEVMDVAVNQKNPDEIFIASAHGPWRTRDGGANWQALSRGLPVPYCSRVVLDSVLYGHVLLASELGIYTLTADSVWIPVNPMITYPMILDSDLDVSKHVYSRDLSRPIYSRIVKIRSVVQVSLERWIAASENAGYIISLDSGKTFSCLSDWRGGCWCVSENQYSRISGGKAGSTSMEFSHGDVNMIVGNDRIRNVHACIQIGRTNFFGSLGNGIVANAPMFSTLPGLQIWTLKAFRIQE